MPEEQPVDEGASVEGQPTGWRRVTGSKWVFAIGVSAIVFGIGAVLIVSSSNDQGTSTASGTDPSVSASLTDPVEKCVVTVMGLMAKSLQAVQNGYQNGIDPNDVAVQYGFHSVTWQAFSQSQATLVGDVYTNGEAGALTRIQPFVRQQCAPAAFPQPTG